jgi:hypothetical protein
MNIKATETGLCTIVKDPFEKYSYTTPKMGVDRITFILFQSCN